MHSSLQTQRRPHSLPGCSPAEGCCATMGPPPLIEFAAGCWTCGRPDGNCCGRGGPLLLIELKVEGLDAPGASWKLFVACGYPAAAGYPLVGPNGLFPAPAESLRSDMSCKLRMRQSRETWLSLPSDMHFRTSYLPLSFSYYSNASGRWPISQPNRI